MAYQTHATKILGDHWVKNTASIPTASQQVKQITPIMAGGLHVDEHDIQPLQHLVKILKAFAIV